MSKGKMASSACAACRHQRKKCSAECLLAPHFHSGRSSKDIEPEQRADAANSLVYEATARVEDPVYGCTRATQQLQKRIADLESQLAATQAELLNMRFTNEKPVYPLSTGVDDAGNILYSPSQQSEYSLREEEDPMLLWKPLWQV